MSSKSISFLILLCTLFQLNFTSKPSSNQTINAVIGDVSFVDAFGRLPNAGDPEILRITTHLNYVSSLLATADVSHLSNSQRENREKVLALLEIYIQENPFPKNYDYQNERRPTFIDKHGSICAVGFLVQQTVGDEAAQAINSVYKYGFVMEMESELLDEWLNEYGLTRKEAAMIQPSYGPVFGGEKDRTSKEVGIEYGGTSLLLASSQIMLTSLNRKSLSSFNNKKWVSVATSGLGLASVFLGLEGLDRSKQNYYVRESGIINTTIYYVNEKNDVLKTISIANITLGSASFILNTYQAFNNRHTKETQKISFTPSAEYVPGLNETVPTANLLVRF